MHTPAATWLLFWFLKAGRVSKFWSFLFPVKSGGGLGEGVIPPLFPRRLDLGFLWEGMSAPFYTVSPPTDRVVGVHELPVQTWYVSLWRGR